MRVTGGKLKNRRLLSPKSATTRPTLEKLRQTVFNIIQQNLEGATMLDLFSGSGAMGIEALSRGAAHVTFVEKDHLACHILEQNLQHLAILPFSTLIQGDVLPTLKSLDKQQKSFDLIYSDPPYSQDMQKEVIFFIDSCSLLAPGGRFFVEERYEKSSSLLSLPLQTLHLLSHRRVGEALLLLFTRSI